MKKETDKKKDLFDEARNVLIVGLAIGGITCLQYLNILKLTFIPPWVGLILSPCALVYAGILFYKASKARETKIT